MSIDKFTKQPGDTQDYDIDFSEYLEVHNDVATAHTVVVESGITVNASFLNRGVVKVWLSSGTDGESYKLTVTITTAGGRVKQHDILIKVRDL